MTRRSFQLALLLPLLCAGCTHRATTPGRGTPAPLATQHIEMEPLEVVAQRRAGRLELVHRDAASLFRSAGEAFEAQDFARAATDYELLLTDFPDSSYSLITRYNLGLALEQLGRFPESLARYREILALAPTSTDALDARFRIAICQHNQGEHAAEAETLREILAWTALGHEDRLLAQIRLGDALLDSGQLDEAERIYRGILARPGLKGMPTPLTTPVPVQAQAQYGLAQIEHERFRRVQIRLPQAQMEKDIHEKASTFLRAQSAYLRTIHLKVSEFVAAAGLKIGTLYEEFYRDLLQAPVPAELSGEEVDVYFEELRRVIRPLVEQAIHVYERNLVYSERFGVDGDWVGETRERLDKLRRFLGGQFAAEPGFFRPPEADPANPAFVGPPDPTAEPAPAATEPAAATAEPAPAASGPAPTTTEPAPAPTTGPAPAAAPAPATEPPPPGGPPAP